MGHVLNVQNVMVVKTILVLANMFVRDAKNRTSFYQKLKNTGNC